jgi:hypothetical protein
MNSETRNNPATWGITQQEMDFANEYVMLFFHSSGIYAEMGIDAARKVGYEVSADSNKADALQKSLIGKVKVKNYIDFEIARFREILSGEQRRNLWKYISDFTGSTPESDAASNDYGSIIRH